MLPAHPANFSVPSGISVSVVIPVYRSAESLPLLLQRLHTVFETAQETYEIICVEDCSPDESWEVLKTLKDQYGQTLKIARLLVNSGQHNALLCGLRLAEGSIVITMDDDLQNPPEEIPKLVAAIRQGYDLAIGAYEAKRHSRVRNASGSFIDRVLRQIFNLPPEFQLTSFRAAKRVVVENVCHMGGVFPYITAMLFSNATTYTNVFVRHDPRPYGRSNYNLKRSFILAANLIFSYSPYPLYLVALLCFVAFLCTILFSLGVAVIALLQGTPPGWASTIIIVSLFNGFTLFCLVIFGVYLSRISQQVTRAKVPYIISELHE